MKVSKTENRFKTGFKQPKTGFPKNPVLTSVDHIPARPLTYRILISSPNPIILVK